MLLALSSGKTGACSSIKISIESEQKNHFTTKFDEWKLTIDLDRAYTSKLLMQLIKYQKQKALGEESAANPIKGLLN